METVVAEFDNRVCLGDIEAIGLCWEQFLEGSKIVDSSLVGSVCRVQTCDGTAKIDMNQLNGFGIDAIRFCFDSEDLREVRVELQKRIDRIMHNFGNKSENLQFLISHLDVPIEMLIHTVGVSIEDCEQAIVRIINRRCAFGEIEDWKPISEFSFAQFPLFNSFDKTVEKIVNDYFKTLEKYYSRFHFIAIVDNTV